MSSLIATKYYINLVVNYVAKIYLVQILSHQFSRQLCHQLSRPNILLLIKSSIMSSIISSKHYLVNLVVMSIILTKYYVVNLVVNYNVNDLDQILCQFSRQLCRHLSQPNIFSSI